MKFFKCEICQNTFQAEIKGSCPYCGSRILTEITQTAQNINYQPVQPQPVQEPVCEQLPPPVEEKRGNGCLIGCIAGAVILIIITIVIIMLFMVLKHNENKSDSTITEHNNVVQTVKNEPDENTSKNEDITLTNSVPSCIGCGSINYNLEAFYVSLPQRFKLDYNDSNTKEFRYSYVTFKTNDNTENIVIYPYFEIDENMSLDEILANMYPDELSSYYTVSSYDVSNNNNDFDLIFALGYNQTIMDFTKKFYKINATWSDGTVGHINFTVYKAISSSGNIRTLITNIFEYHYVNGKTASPFTADKAESIAKSVQYNFNWIKN